MLYMFELCFYQAIPIDIFYLIKKKKSPLNFEEFAEFDNK